MRFRCSLPEYTSAPYWRPLPSANVPRCHRYNDDPNVQDRPPPLPCYTGRMEPVTAATVATTVVTVIKALRVLRQLAKDLGNGDVQNQIADVYDMVLDLKDAEIAGREREARLIHRCEELKNDLARVNDWETEKARHFLRQIGDVASVYMPRPSVDIPDPYWLCANCFEDRQKSYLQPGTWDAVGRPWTCPRCSATFTLDYVLVPRW